MREVMTWQELGSGTRELAEAIHDDGYAPDMVLAIDECALANARRM